MCSVMKMIKPKIIFLPTLFVPSVIRFEIDKRRNEDIWMRHGLDVYHDSSDYQSNAWVTYGYARTEV